MKKPQWITFLVAICSVAALYLFGKTTPSKKPIISSFSESQSDLLSLNSDSILNTARRHLSSEQAVRINTLENSISRGDVKEQQLKIYHQLAHFWADTIGVFEPYAWYLAKAARLENSEKSLTFAARLFLDNLQTEDETTLRKWKALQAKDLYERSLKINPNNDSAKVGLGACYLFGNFSATPMEGILKIREVAEKDSNNTYAQMMLAKGSLISGQYDKAISRLLTIHRLEPNNAEPVLILADTYERIGDNLNAIEWYRKSIQYINRQDVKAEIEKRIEELKNKN